MDLTKKKCEPCEGGIMPFTNEESEMHLKYVNKWKLIGIKIEKDFDFKDFEKALKFVNKVAAIAEKEGHHPNILIHSWNKVKLEIYTHSIGGLSVNDFILAAKIDKIK
ncbi:MAG TPA: 4a-hydroxytetrahydrobiopterin dehydratase [archaeon]|nr:4a-hydroxytetrahydrobiopterin dehydratase [archaeon]